MLALQVALSGMQGSLGGPRWKLRDHLSKELKPRYRGEQSIWRREGQTSDQYVCTQCGKYKGGKEEGVV